MITNRKHILYSEIEVFSTAIQLLSIVNCYVRICHEAMWLVVCKQ